MLSVRPATIARFCEKMKILIEANPLAEWLIPILFFTLHASVLYLLHSKLKEIVLGIPVTTIGKNQNLLIYPPGFCNPTYARGNGKSNI